jgi:hypothetical protein
MSSRRDEQVVEEDYSNKNVLFEVVASFAGALEALEYRTGVAVHLSLALLPVQPPDCIGKR